MSNYDSGMLMTIILWVFGLFVYFLPAVVAANRKHNNAAAIFMTTLFFGWSCLGWGIAFIWAMTNNTQDD